jgi:hypothetical protein
MAASLEREFMRCKNERGSIMRGSTFAVAMMKAFVLGSEFTR